MKNVANYKIPHIPQARSPFYRSSPRALISPPIPQRDQSSSPPEVQIDVLHLGASLNGFQIELGLSPCLEPATVDSAEPLFCFTPRTSPTHSSTPDAESDGTQQARDAAIARRRRSNLLYSCSARPVPEVGRTRRSTMSDRRRFVNIVIGFYRHHPTKDYRVLLISQNYPKYSLHNLTVGSDESRHIKVTMPAVSLPSVEQKLLNGLINLRHCPPPVQHRGNLHWCPYGARDITEGGGDIIVFDTEAESFRWVRSPGQLCYNRKLFNMKGTLAFWGGSAPNFTAINVWVMQDYEAEIWAFKYRIDLSTVDSSRRLYTTSLKKKRKKKTPLDSTVTLFNDMAVLNDRELLIKFNGKHVLRCDIDGKFLGIVNLGTCQYRMSLTQHCFQESIVPIPYHGMQEEDEESPFYTGHV
ncbi:hypothetical protein ACQ4PT_032373 [Festuca glaucescens]